MLPITSRSAAFSRPTTVQGSVRAPVSYQGSMDANDLLDLYVGNTHYRKINRYMRAPDHDAGVGEILDEMVTRDGRKPMSQADALAKVTAEREAANHYLNNVMPAQKQFMANADPDDFDVFFDSPLEEFTNSPQGDYLKSLVGAYGGNNGDYQITAQKVLLNPAEPRVAQLSSWKPLRQEAEQVVASIPHLERALVQQPRTQEHRKAFNYPETASAWLADPDTSFIEPLEDPKDLLGFEQQMYQHLKQQGKSIFADTNDDDFSVTPSNDAIAFAQSVINGQRKLESPIQKSVDTLYRGFHFKDPAEYQSFVGNHAPGTVVDYPAFTSTTSNTNIQQGFADGRSGEHPVLMEIQQPAQGRWVNNTAESEYLYPSNSRFEIVGSEPIPGDMAGTKLIARETTAPTAVQARTAGMLERLKGKGHYIPEQVSAAPEPVRQPRKSRSAYAHLMTSNPTQPMPVDYVGYDGAERYPMWSGSAAL